MALIHGGDTEGFKARFGRAPLDFSVNTNPLGMPLAAVQAAKAAVEQAGDYPDPLCRRLSTALAHHHGVPGPMVLCGGGAADLIYRLVYALRPQKAMVLAPSFAEYELALEAAGCTVVRHPLYKEEGFGLTPRILEAITPQVELLFLCEPANPTGQTTDDGLLRQVVRRCGETGTRLVVDECFNGFLDDAATHTLAPLVPDAPQLFILNAFTKLYAMAGLRLGYCLCADAALLQRMQTVQQPWAVSGPAQAAGLAALADDAYLAETTRLVAPQRRWLAQQLAALGLEVYGSKANFIFFHTTIPYFFERMGEQGLLLRDCANYPGLGPGYYRAAVRTAPDNRRLVQAVEELVKAKNTPQE